MKKLLLALLPALTVTAVARESKVSSPDGKLVVNISDAGGRATYSVSIDGQTVVKPSLLGLKTDMGDFTQGLTIKGEKTDVVSKDYNMWQTKQRHYSYMANTLRLEMATADEKNMAVVFQVSNNDVAFRYELPRQKGDNPKTAIVSEEATSFSLPDGTTTFLTPQIDPMKGWERTKPSYEEEYKADAPMSERSQYGQGYTFPCLYKIRGEREEVRGKSGEGRDKSGEVRGERATLWVLISETGVSSQYCGSHLSDYKPGQGYTIAYPQEGENNGFGTANASIALPGATPWRTITVGTTLKPIVETSIAYDVVEPLYEPSQNYQGGRYTWSWLIWQDNSINYDDQVRFIDLAAAMGYEYCLVDNWWDSQIGRKRIEELSRYAQSKGVSLMLWYNSNGHWNDAPQTPRDRMSTNIARDQEMAWLKSIGVKGIKVDFFAGDKQETMKLYEDILYDANRYGIACIFHGCTIPRGWERMYPNYVASEAVLASENVYFSEHHAEQEPFQLTMHPFCRNAVGTIDWGGVIMNKYLSKDNKSRHQRRTTDVFEIATAFTNQTAVQCIAMQPNNLQELPQVELDFLKRIPTTWTETRFLDGYPGKYVVLARHDGKQWYVAGLNALKEPLTLTLDLTGLNVTHQLVDQTDKKGRITGVHALPLKPDKKGKVKVTLQPNGGIVIY